MNKIKFSIVLLLFIAGNIYSQETFQFLQLETSPRAAALANTFVSAKGDPNVIFYNPAGVNTLEKTPVSFSFLKHVLDINSVSLAFSQEFEGIGRLAGGIQYVNYGTFTERDQYGNAGGEFGASDLALSVTYGNELSENFYYGFSLKFIYSGIASQSATGLGGDFGLYYTIPENDWNFGFSVMNLGTQLTSYYSTKENLPLDIKIGVSKSLEHLPLTFYFAFNQLNNENERFKNLTFGGELKMNKVITLRFGYDNNKRSDLKAGTKSGLAGFNVGLGFKVSSYNVDYAFSSMGAIGALHRIGVTTNL